MGFPCASNTIYHHFEEQKPSLTISLFTAGKGGPIKIFLPLFILIKNYLKQLQKIT